LAAQKGDANSQYNLGVMYTNGQGVKKNLSQAKEWFQKACENGLQQGCDASQKPGSPE
jgi:uncharacterized protein